MIQIQNCNTHTAHARARARTHTHTHRGKNVPNNSVSLNSLLTIVARTGKHFFFFKYHPHSYSRKVSYLLTCHNYVMMRGFAMHGNGRYTPEKDLDLHTWLLDKKWSLLRTGYHVKQNHKLDGHSFLALNTRRTI